ncbi:hypothetical protein V8F20_007278 [Naviculisporaceae sp. PSN 640]
MTCGDSWLNIHVLEQFSSPPTAWYADRDGALVNTKNIKGGYCEIDTSDTFECWIALGMSWGTRQLKCHALFSQASIWA